MKRLFKHWIRGVLLMLLLLLGVHTSRAETNSAVQIVHQSREAVGEGMLEKARDLARHVTEQDPAYPEGWKQLGRVHMHMQNYTAAIQAFDSMNLVGPEDSEVNTWRLLIALEQAEPSEVFERVNALDRDTFAGLGENYILRLTSLALNQNQQGTAVQNLNRWGTQVDDPVSAKAAFALAAAIESPAPKAQKELEDFSTKYPNQKNPFLAYGWWMLGNRSIAAGHEDQALVAMKTALSIRPNWVPALRELGWLYRRNGNLTGAITVWEKGLPQGHPEWGIWIAETHLELRQPAESLHVCERALAQNPELEELKILTLMSLNIQNRDREAEVYQAGLSARSIELATSRADVYRGNFDQAILRMETLLQKTPEDAALSTLLDRTYKSWLQAQPGKLDALVKMNLRHPEDPAIWRDLGWAQWADGQQKKALASFDQALQRSVGHADQLTLQVFAALSESGEGAAAREWFARWNPNPNWTELGVQLTRLGRGSAARPALEAAWKTDLSNALLGLYLGNARVLHGKWQDMDDYLLHFLKKPWAQQSTFDRELAGTVMLQVGGLPGSLRSLEELLSHLRTSDDPDPLLTDLLAAAANRRASYQDHDTAFAYYREALNRDPNRFIWTQADRSASRLNRQDDSLALLRDVMEKTDVEAIRVGIQGKQAEHQQQWQEAIRHYTQSLQVHPDQPILRYTLFNLLVQQGQLEQAQVHIQWMAAQVDAGKSSTMISLAEMLGTLGRPEEALHFWEQLHQKNPDVAYYRLGMARTLIQLCRLEEAIRQLESLIAQSPEPKAFLLLGEIKLSQNHTDQALALAASGLSIERMPSLLRLQAEAAERAGKTDVALQTANELLALQPGNIPIARLKGRSLMELEEWESAEEYFKTLLERNPGFVPAQLRLREIHTARREFKDAVRVSKTLEEQRPWDLDASRLLAISLSEADRFRPALKRLRKLARIDPASLTPILVYRDVSHCTTPGKSSVSQIQAHMQALYDHGYQAVRPSQLHEPSISNRIMIVLSGASKSVIEALDPSVKKLNAHIVAGRSLEISPSMTPSGSDLLQSIERSDHWTVASEGSPAMYPIPIREDGLLGNPLTHRKFIGTTKESLKEYQARIEQLMTNSITAQQPSPRVFLYPQGDMGQYTLDTDLETLEVLRKTAAQHFDLSIIADEKGYVADSGSPHLLPARHVPPHWDSTHLLEHLHQTHPVISGTLQLAKVLYWNRQHEKANQAFQQALDLGANAEDVHYHWGANGLQQGDLPSALNHLQAAIDLNTNEVRYATTMKRAHRKTQPEIEIRGTYTTDSEDRSFQSYGGKLFTHIYNRLAVQGFLDHHNWERDGLGDEYGEKYGLGLTLYPLMQTWIHADVWKFDFSTEGLDDMYGGSASVRLPLTWLSGHLNLIYRHDQVETVEAVREEIREDQYAIQAYFRMLDEFDIYLNGIYSELNDGNEITAVDGRAVWRAKEWPFLGLGYLFRFGDSDFDPFEYYAPENLEQHQGYLSIRGAHRRLHYALSARAGYNREEDADWRFIWGLRGLLEARITEHLKVYGDGVYQESDTYDRNSIHFGVKGSL